MQFAVTSFLAPAECSMFVLGNQWLISRPLLPLLTLLPLLAAPLINGCLHCCVYSELGSHSSGPIRSCSIPSPFSTYHFKAEPLLYSRHVDRRVGCLLAIFIRVQTC